MMKNAEIHQYAHNLAEMSLENGFDENAYLLKAVSEMALRQQGIEVDLLPDSDVDEKINDLMQNFIFYYNMHSVETLGQVMQTIRKIVSEIYHGCENEQERQVVMKEIDIIKKIR